MSTSTHESHWPPELRYLLERHPRARWPDELAPRAAFWLEVHAHLRRDCAGLEAATEDHRAGRTQAAQFTVIAAARWHGLIAAMHGHHQIEDFQYFPAFRLDEPRLAPGFDRLEAEHGALSGDIAAGERALTELKTAVECAAAGSSAPAIAAERYAAAAQRLCARLRSHLTDEEDLVVPLLIERSGR